MGDRAVVIFAGDGQDFAAVYSHWGGQDIEEMLGAFFVAEDENKQHDNRFGDPEYLAARFAVWSSDSRGTGVGIVPTDRREYTNVRVHCDNEKHPRLERLPEYGEGEGAA
jgi:hypothetical protein